MKEKALRLIPYFLLLNIILMTFLPIKISYGATADIDPNFGKAPIIDGIIDDSTNEWREAKKLKINLTDLPVKFWVLQTNLDLYISVQVDLEVGYHNTTEFVAILVSKNSSEAREDFIDAKIIQFNNITSESFNYSDYYINESVFINDAIPHGEGAAGYEGITTIYEFSIPLNQSESTVEEEDSLLSYENSYAFNVSYGGIPFYPQGIIKSTIVLINIKLPQTHQILPVELTLGILSIIAFSVTGILLVVYIYRIFKLKEKIERLRR
ncbi:MAG: hypothetical protein ACFE8N_06595 [Promethearchaeota archaeon]